MVYFGAEYPQSAFGHSFVDACHIMPFSHSHDDRVSNGLALCPNMHRAFDRGLLSVDGEYRILVSPHVREDESHAYSLAQLAGKRMLLPTKLQYWPRQEGLEWHREEVFKG
ncbi:HNH endonuclease [Olivibacter sitiensis]|uniref:HNH endonuclease n=1 Tax=Olivibacter sitiensis TaxID=376470 RepID=UPI00041D3CEC|nr:HNH endonuclease [Olivibacter sitiensis]